MNHISTYININDIRHKIDSCKNQKLHTENIDIIVNSHFIGFGTEICIEIIPKLDIVSDHIDFCVEFGEKYDSNQLLFFNNASCTNDPVSIIELKDDIITRDIALFKSGKYYFNAAMTTAKKFYTYFISNNKGTTIRFSLEGKKLSAGQKYELEHFVINYEIYGGKFFDSYTKYMAQKYNITLPQKIESGWSSWSCMYKTVTQEKVIKEIKLLSENYASFGADLVQIDDGWQNGSTFCADWTSHRERFSKGLENISNDLKETGLNLGLWYAPTLFQNDCEMFKNHYDYNIFDKDGNTKTVVGDENKPGAIYPLDLENNDVIEHICNSFERSVNEYGCNYFKIDFLIRSLLRAYDHELVHYKKGYSVEVYQNTMKKIREVVGSDSYMLACGAPITESIGVFDAIRTSPDITWETEAPNHPGYFKIIEMDAQNVFLRSYYHGKVFINDPDALVVRGNIGDVDDNFASTIDEAKVWATVVAMSGGTILINEEIEKLDTSRREIIQNILPPSGLSLVPEDFFEYPLCTKISIYHNERRIAAVFNWDEKPADKFIKNDDTVFAFDCWSKKFTGRFDGNIDFENMPAHSVKALMLVAVPTVASAEKYSSNKPIFLCDDYNFYMGIKVQACYTEECLQIDGAQGNLYLYVPSGVKIENHIEETVFIDSEKNSIVKVANTDKIYYRSVD